jgi:prepilin-type N-terminal cleavage/methylation domain-containing protein
MRKSPAAAFTLLEMLTVLAIIVILSSIVLGVAGYVQKRSALARASGEISMLGAACESYKSDNGSYPRDIPSTAAGTSVTDLISPKQHFIPTATQYSASSLFLYKELTGDRMKGTTSGTPPDGITDEGAQRYIKEMDPRILNAVKNATTKAITQVNYLQDPFGFPYAYSTAAALAEEKFQTGLLKGQKVTRPSGAALPGFNLGSFDLWSTGGSSPKANPASSKQDLEWAKWIKNW